MRIDRTRNTIRSIGWGSVNNVITIAVPFLTRTLILRYLGSEYVGLGSLFVSIFNVLGLVELGFGSAITFSLYKPIAENDDAKICAILRFARMVYRVMGGIMLAVGLLLVPFLRDLVKGETPAGINIYLLYAIYLASYTLSYMTFSYRYCLIMAMQRNDVYLNVVTVVRLFVSALQVYALLRFQNYYLYCLCRLIEALLTNICALVVSNRMYPQYQCRGRLDKAEIQAIKKHIAGLLASKICYQSRNAFDSIIISSFLGLVLVGQYNNYFMILSSVAAIMRLLLTAMEGGMGNSIAVETKEKNYQDLRKINFIYLWIVAWFSATLFSLYQPFMKLWVGPEMMFSFRIVGMFTLYFFIQETTGILGNYVSVTGLWWRCRLAYILEAIGNLVLNFALGYFFGVPGVLAATLLTIAAIHIPTAIHVLFKYYFTPDGKKGLIADIVMILLTAIGATVATWFATSLLPTDGNEIVLFLLKGLICCIVPNVILWLCLHRTPSFRTAESWLKWKIMNGRKTTRESV